MTLDVSQAEVGRLRMWGEILDLRKASFVPMVDELQTAGIIHHMSLEAHVDAKTRVLESLVTEQPNVAVEASAASKGECCRDPAPALQALVGLPFDAQFPKELGRVFGGPRGCSHLLTLFFQAASALPPALDFEAAARAAAPAGRRPGERLFRRAIYVDGFEPDADGLHLAISLMDYHSAPLEGGDRRLDLLGAHHEVRVLAHVRLSDLAFVSLEAGERTRSRASLDAQWKDRSGAVASLVGRSVMPGLGTQLRAMFGDRPEERRLLDTLLQIAPGFVQCTPALSDRMFDQVKANDAKRVRHGMPRFLASGGGADSCYIWRQDGPLLQIWQPPEDEA
jgi:hypothetical protein